MATIGTNIKKLQQALNLRGERIMLDTHQFYSKTQNRPITMYSISKSVDTERSTDNIKLFTSASQVHILFYLRDYWCKVNGLPIPTEDIEWNKAKQKYGIEF